MANHNLFFSLTIVPRWPKVGSCFVLSYGIWLFYLSNWELIKKRGNGIYGFLVYWFFQLGFSCCFHSRNHVFLSPNRVLCLSVQEICFGKDLFLSKQFYILICFFFVLSAFLHQNRFQISRHILKDQFFLFPLTILFKAMVL